MTVTFNIPNFDGIKLERELEPMQTGKATSWLGEYHWVKLAVTEDNKYANTVTQITDWCREHFGKSGAKWFEKNGQFYFKDERDMSMFILRWS
jgi:hypothetical protein